MGQQRARVKDVHDTEDFKYSMWYTRLVKTYGKWYNYHYATSHHVPYPCPHCHSNEGFVFFEYEDACLKYEIYYQGYTPPN